MGSAGQDRARGTVWVVASGLAARGGQFLCGRDRLEVQTEQGRHADLVRAGMAEAVDLVEDGLDFVVVVLLGLGVVLGPVLPDRQAVGLAVDLWREEVLDPLAGGSLEAVSYTHLR